MAPSWQCGTSGSVSSVVQGYSSLPPRTRGASRHCSWTCKEGPSRKTKARSICFAWKSLPHEVSCCWPLTQGWNSPNGWEELQGWALHMHWFCIVHSIATSIGVQYRVPLYGTAQLFFFTVHFVTMYTAALDDDKTVILLYSESIIYDNIHLYGIHCCHGVFL